jgi:hypothetical protein
MSLLIPDLEQQLRKVVRAQSTSAASARRRAPSGSRRPSIALATVPALVIAASAAILLATSSGSATSDLRAKQLERVNVATAHAAVAQSSGVRIAPSLIRYFGVFRNHRVGQAADVASMRPELARTSAAQGLNVADAILVPIGPGTGTWVIPGATQVCIFDDTGSGVCNSPTDGPGAPTTGGFYMRSSPGSLGGGYGILGLVPDGNNTVTLTLSDGSSRTVPVVNNVYSVSGLPAAPTAVELKDATGAVKTVTIG